MAPSPQITGTAEASCTNPAAPYTLPPLISALGEVIDQLTQATRHATQTSASRTLMFPARSWAKPECNTPRRSPPRWAKSKYNGGATSG
jgi:hypothetical protein